MSKPSPKKKVLLVGLVLVSLLPSISFAQSSPSETSTATGAGLAASASANYELAFGDTLQIDLYTPESVSLVQRLDHNGAISIFPAGSIKLGGLSVEAARLLIQKKMSVFYKRPQVAVRVIQVRTFDINLVGSAAKPGRYLIDGLTGASQAIQKCGGPAADGGLRTIEIRNPAGKTIRVINYLRWLRRGSKVDNPKMEFDQTIFIPPRNKDVKISGSVLYPGAYELLPGETFSQFLASAAGGTLQVANTKQIEVSRLKPDGQRLKMLLDLASTQASQPVQFGDEIAVLDLALWQSSIVVLGELRGAQALNNAAGSKDSGGAAAGAAETARVQVSPRIRYRIREGERVSDVVIQLGGPTELANLSRARIQRKDDKGKTVNLDFSLKDALKNAGTEMDPFVQDGDLFVVAPVATSVYVIGEAQTPGAIPFKPGVGFREYIALAGGPKSNCWRRECRLIRVKDNPENPSIYQINLDDYIREKGFANLVVEPGDIIFLPHEDESIFKQISTALSTVSPLLFLLTR